MPLQTDMRRVFPILCCVALAIAAVVLLTLPAAAEDPPAPLIRWAYRSMTKEQLLELGGKDFDAGLNKLGEEGWELTAFDGTYRFKRVQIARPTLPLNQATDRANRTNAADYANRLSIAEYDVRAQRDRVAWVERMILKGLMAENFAKAEREILRRVEMNLQVLRMQGEAALPAPRTTDKKDAITPK